MFISIGYSYFLIKESVDGDRGTKKFIYTFDRVRTFAAISPSLVIEQMEKK